MDEYDLFGLPKAYTGRIKRLQDTSILQHLTTYVATGSTATPDQCIYIDPQQGFLCHLTADASALGHGCFCTTHARTAIAERIMFSAGTSKLCLCLSKKSLTSFIGAMRLVYAKPSNAPIDRKLRNRIVGHEDGSNGEVQGLCLAE